MFFFSQRENFFFQSKEREWERERENTHGKTKKYSPGLYWLNTELSVEPLRLTFGNITKFTIFSKTRD